LIRALNNSKLITKEIIIREALGIKRDNEPVCFGVPFKKGQLHKPEALSIYNGHGRFVPMQTTTLGLWSDNSVKWLLLEFQAVVDANSESQYYAVLDQPRQIDKKILVCNENNSLMVNTGRARFHIEKETFVPFTKIVSSGKDLYGDRRGRCFLAIDGKEITPKVVGIEVEHEGPIRTTILIQGNFSSRGNKKINFISRLNFFADKSLIKIDFTLRNSRAAYHPGGLWDLGDKASLIFRELCIEFPLENKSLHDIVYSLQNGSHTGSANGKELLIYQESSGGENWNSPNHKNRFGRVPFRIKGYHVYEGNKLVDRGDRATPVIWIGSSKTGISMSIPYFWQNFPKAIEVKDNSLQIGLFPKYFEDMHELQGGEQKTETFFIDFSSQPSDLMWVRDPLTPFIRPEEYERSGVIPNFKLDHNNVNYDYLKLINAAIKGDNSFIAKREVIDEYGWRNFGEIYADHEAVNSSDDYFISHYNNQYDLIYSAFRQYISTNDISWYRTMIELAAHVRDIDIYHTDEDRDEYNHGLFWHTDHYVDAATSTHRSFSKEHLNTKGPRFCGGGPGTEHCYSTGLMYEYFLTGDVACRDAVIQLADWSIKALSTPTTLLGLLYMIKNKLPVWINVFKGMREASHIFPLSRRTGNALIACLDAFELSGNTSYIRKAEEFINGCVHPCDYVANRNLLDAESHWSYTVFFSAVGRYLDKKIDIDEIDMIYEYARESLVVYAKWMLENEYPYLEKKETLEFQTETWPAQDMRKSCVLYYAAKYSEGDLKKAFIEKAGFFFESSVRGIQSFPTKNLTRPVALLLQNGWVEPFLKNNSVESAPKLSGDFDFSSAPAFLTRADVIKQIGSDPLSALKNSSIRKELLWIRNRARSVVSKN
jgi:hypothetical protein